MYWVFLQVCPHKMPKIIQTESMVLTRQVTQRISEMLEEVSHVFTPRKTKCRSTVKVKMHFSSAKNLLQLLQHHR